jgi:hypothetical protein
MFRKLDVRLPAEDRIELSAWLDHDHIAVTDLALKAYECALEPKRLVMLRGGHFDPCLGQYETASHVAIEWFKAHL